MERARRVFLQQMTWGVAGLTLPSLARPAEAGTHAHTPGGIAWKTWAEGTAKAASEHKAIGLLIYADWCPHCRELEPVFHTPDIVKLATPLIMIRQNADEHTDWLVQRFGALGSYVPRLFFLHPDASVARDITSGNARFPYYYQAHHPDRLQDAMKRAAALGGKRG